MAGLVSMTGEPIWVPVLSATAALGAAFSPNTVPMASAHTSDSATSSAPPWRLLLR